jgi:cytochrome P450
MHKERRRLLNPVFSRTGVFKLEPIIHDKARIMINKIDRLREKNDINVYDALRCLTTEVIMEFAFAKSANMLEEQETTFESWFLTAFDAVAGSLWKMQEFPLLRKIAGRLPDKLVERLDPQLVNVFRMLKVFTVPNTYSRTFLILAWELMSVLLYQYAESCLNHYEIHGNTTSHPVVFDNLSSLSHQNKVTEALDILIAGADTTASTLTAGMMHILSNPKIHTKLVNALGGVGAYSGNAEAFQLLELEKIEYLVG